MRIAQVAPLHEAVPPKLYGGTERIVDYLTEQLVAMGHDVTLFASGDSRSSARLVAPCAQALRLDPDCRDRVIYHLLMMERVAEMIDQFDVVHFHCDYIHFPWVRRTRTPHLTTLHGRLDMRDLVPLFTEYSDIPVCSISDAQRAPLPWLNWCGTVYHGLPVDIYDFNPEPGRYLAFVGRFSPEKGFDRAVAIARAAGLPLKVAAKADPADVDYFAQVVRPLLEDPLVDYIGEIGEAEKNELLGNALALLFPIDWPEPFGLVMIEALACGTPVVAFRRGSVPEVIDDGITGFIVDDVAQAVAAVAQIDALDRHECRAAFVTRYSSARMANDYLSLYRAVARGQPQGRALDSIEDQP